MMPETKKALVFEDDPEARAELESIVESLGYGAVSSGARGRVADVVVGINPGIVVWSLRRPLERAGKLADVVREASPGTPVVFVTSGGEWDAYQRVVDESGEDRLPRPWRRPAEPRISPGDVRRNRTAIAGFDPSSP